MFKKKLPFIIFALVAISLGIWAFFIFKQRNSVPMDNAEKIEQPQQIGEQAQKESKDEQAEENEDDTALSDLDENSSEDSDENLLADENTEIEKTNLLEIYNTDCDNKCDKYDDSEEFKYCQEICGFNSKDKDEENSKNCDNLSDLEKDYCLKDLAISEKDLEMCEEIEDSSILKACRNRITEDILDSQPQL